MGFNFEIGRPDSRIRRDRDLGISLPTHNHDNRQPSPALLNLDSCLELKHVISTCTCILIESRKSQRMLTCVSDEKETNKLTTFKQEITGSGVPPSFYSFSHVDQATSWLLHVAVSTLQMRHRASQMNRLNYIDNIRTALDYLEKRHVSRWLQTQI